MEDSPSGPWVRAGAPAAIEDEDPFDDEREPDIEWRTGTALDEFTPIYRALAIWTKTHGPLAPAEVDAMDMTVIAAILGLDVESFEGKHAAWVREYNDAVARGEQL